MCVMAIERNHYDVLGVTQSASPADVRKAYRTLVRRQHPDVSNSSDHGAISAINEAWSVLSDPVKRAAYDRTLSSAHHELRVVAAEHDVDMVYPRAQFPWRSMVVLAVLGIAVVLILNAFASPSTPRPPDQLLQPGSCVNIDSMNYAFEVSCSEPYDAQVVQFVALDMPCPSGTEIHPDRQGMGRACVVGAASSTSAP